MRLTDERIIEIVSASGACQGRAVLRDQLPFFTSSLLEFARAIERETTLKWTDETPTVPGYYWWRSSPKTKARIGYVGLARFFAYGPLQSKNMELCVWWHEDKPRPAAEIYGQWAGPVPQPEE